MLRRATTAAPRLHGGPAGAVAEAQVLRRGSTAAPRAVADAQMLRRGFTAAPRAVADAQMLRRSSTAPRAL